MSFRKARRRRLRHGFVEFGQGLGHEWRQQLAIDPREPWQG